MYWLQTLFGDRKARERWEAGLAWFRLRYLDAEKTTRCLKLLSRAEACGRLAFHHRPAGAISHLYLGLPRTHGRLLQRMAADFGFSLKPVTEVALPPCRRLTVAAELPWERTFMAHIVNESVFVDDDGRNSRFMPQAPALPNGQSASAAWDLPPEPAPGLSMRPLWHEGPPPAHLAATAPDPQRWLLGRSGAGAPLHVAGRVNLYGRQEAVADWLIRQVTQTVATEHANLVVIDGAGDLVPQLKRKGAVTRLLGKQLAYVDIDSDSSAGGFNPLAAVGGETEEEATRRWRHWFQGMGVHSQALPLVSRARQEGVDDITSLQKWLKRLERAGAEAVAARGNAQAASSLSMALKRLTADRTAREWLEWPANRFDILPDGALFFACRGSAWSRRQLLRAALLGAMQAAGARLVVHGFPWSSLDAGLLPVERQILASNGPLFAEGVVLLAESRAPAADELARRFLGADELMAERLQLLGSGEALLVAERETCLVSWQNGKSKPT